MSRRTRFLRWSVVALTSGVLGSMLAAPQRLPRPIARTVDSAVDGAAQFWLWVLNAPRDEPSGRDIQIGSPASPDRDSGAMPRLDHT